MDNTESVSRILNVFSLMVSLDLDEKTDAEALGMLLELLRKENPFILVTRDGPAFLSLVRRFGLVPPKDRDRLFCSDLPPDQVMEVMVRWERIRAIIQGLDNAREVVALAGVADSARPSACEHAQEVDL